MSISSFASSVSCSRLPSFLISRSSLFAVSQTPVSLTAVFLTSHPALQVLFHNDLSFKLKLSQLFFHFLTPHICRTFFRKVAEISLFDIFSSDDDLS